MTPISVINLGKSYGPVNAVRGVSFEVDEGTIFGLIGPDGGGKTTTIRIAVSLLTADTGQITFLGRDVATEPGFVRAHVGYMPQRFSLYQDLSVEENLRFFADLFQVASKDRIDRLRRLYAFSGLEPFRHRRAGALSGGMKQKLALSCMLVHAPRVLVLDEPTFGVDPVSRSEFWDILKELRRDGTTILVSTAYMDEALMCDRVALMHEGKILACDEPGALTSGFPDTLYVAKSPVPHRVHEALLRWDGTATSELFGDGVHVTLKPGVDADLLQARLAPFETENVRVATPSLEDLFLRLMGT